MIKIFLREVYYFFYDLMLIINNCRYEKKFIIISPRLFSFFFKKIFIFDKNKKSFFTQHVRDRFDALTVFEIFGEENYSVSKYKIWNKIEINLQKNLQLNNKPLIIDCGSNIGCSSEYFSRVFEGSHIVQIESNTKSIEFSKKNIFDKNVDYINKAISSDNNSYYIDNSSVDNRSSKISEKGDYKVESITVDQILKKYDKKTYPFLIKIDIEGFEANLFEKNYDWVNKFDIIVIELHDWMLPGKGNSYNFINSISENMKKKNKKDIIISGENLILIKNYE